MNGVKERKKPHIKDYFTKEFIKFLCCNGFAAAVNFGSRMLFSNFMEYIPAVILAYLCGMLTAFILNKLFVFDGKQGKTGRQFLGFALVNVLAIAQTLLFSMLFRDIVFPALNWTLYPDALAHLIGISIPIFTSFLGHKYFSFRK